MYLFVIFAAFTVTFNQIQCQSCVPTVAPFSWANSSSWPLTNESFDEPGLPGSEQLNTFVPAVNDFITKQHNCLRGGQGASNMLKMVWDKEAAEQAQAWASRCSYSHSPITQRTTSLFACGQNIAMSAPTPLSWHSVINLWHNEVKHFTYGAPNNAHGLVVGHYTQVNWATTWQVGCAHVSCPAGTGPPNVTTPWSFFVCNYCPAGNVNGYAYPYAKNGAPCADCPGNCVGGKLCTNSCPYSNSYSNCTQLATQRICNFYTNVAQACKASCECKGKIYLNIQ